MSRPYLKLGEWNAICDICGLEFKSSALRKDWRNLMVCKDDFELRHPQDFLRVPKDNPSIPWARPESEVFVAPACYLWTQSAYADLGTADCMKADYTPLPYAQLVYMQYPTPPWQVPSLRGSAIPGFAIPGYSIPSEPTFGVT